MALLPSFSLPLTYQIYVYKNIYFNRVMVTTIRPLRLNTTVASCIALLLTLLSGCARFDITDEDPMAGDPGVGGRMIGFSTLSIDKTRAANEMFSNYGVFAQKSGSDGEWYMDHVQVNGLNNSYSPEKYWPTGSLSFYAYAPYNSANAAIITSTVGHLPVTYSVPGSDAAPGLANEDFTIAIPLTAKTQADGAMAFAFQHMLAKITVNATLGSGLTGYSLDLSQSTVVLKVAENRRSTRLTDLMPAWDPAFAVGSTPATYRANFTQNATSIIPPTFQIIPQLAYNPGAVDPAQKSRASIHVKNVGIKYQQQTSLNGDLALYQIAENDITNNQFATGKHYTITLQVQRTDQLSGSFTDNRDGNVYKTVIIANQVWMAENLRYLPSVQNTADYNSACYYVYGYNGINTAAAKATPNYLNYGVLYNWAAAMTSKSESNTNPSGVKGICPEGWHLPSEAEWLQLTSYLNSSGAAGGILKEKGTSHWNSPNSGATNTFGFTALGGGYRGDVGNFSQLKNRGYWWSTTADIGNSCARYFYLNYDNASASIFYDKNTQNKSWGLSVRCVRN